MYTILIYRIHDYMSGLRIYNTAGSLVDEQTQNVCSSRLQIRCDAASAVWESLMNHIKLALQHQPCLFQTCCCPAWHSSFVHYQCLQQNPTISVDKLQPKWVKIRERRSNHNFHLICTILTRYLHIQLPRTCPHRTTTRYRTPSCCRWQQHLFRSRHCQGQPMTLLAIGLPTKFTFYLDT